MDFIDVKYINLISSQLQKFKKVKPYLYNFRCPICGDSKKNKNKARAFLYRVKNNSNFKCHNCGLSVSFNTFLKQFDIETHKKYIFEKFKDGKTGKNFTSESPEDIFSRMNSSKPKFRKKIEVNLPDAFDISISKKYLESRSIFSGSFYYAKNFKEFVNTLKPGTFKDVEFGEERIVIPLVRNDKLIGFQGRALSKNPIKYLTIMLDEDEPKIYGLDTINKDLPVYVVEGPFDSTFLNNSVALCGSDGDVSCIEGSDIVLVYDNEPRNKEIVGRIERAIEGGKRVVIWPNNIVEKDINDMVLAGHKVQDLVESNTFTGLQAKLKFTTWKKI
tara:strand:+ start:10220 stop:11212 length:993 start_codon:yes stop_codon:yes gene_type:complete